MSLNVNDETNFKNFHYQKRGEHLMSKRPDVVLISSNREDVAAVASTRCWDAGKRNALVVGDRIEVMAIKSLRISDDSGGVTSGIINSIEEAPVGQRFYSPLWQTDKHGNPIPKRYRISLAPNSIEYKAVLNDEQINTYGERCSRSGILRLKKA